MPPPPPPPPYGGGASNNGGGAPVPAPPTPAPHHPQHHHHDSDDDGEGKPFFQENPLEMVGLDPDELLEWAAEAAAAGDGGGDGGDGLLLLLPTTPPPPLGGGGGGAEASGGPLSQVADLERGGGGPGGGGGRRRAAAAPPLPGLALRHGNNNADDAAATAPLPHSSQQQQSQQQRLAAASSSRPQNLKALSMARDPRGVFLALVRLLLPSLAFSSPSSSSSRGGPAKNRAPRRASSSSSPSPLPFFTRLDAAVLKNVAACAGASMADPIMSVVDTHFVGRLGVAELAAMGPNSALFSVLYFLMFTSLAVLCTQSMAAARARGDPAGVGRGFAQAMAAALALSVPVALVLAAFPDVALHAFHATPETMKDARSYCVLRALALPAALTMVVCQAAFRSLLDLRTPLLVVAAATVANLVLDQALMFGPVAHWGVAGCGLATLGSQYIGAGLFALCIWRKRRAFGLAQALAAAAGGGGGGGGGGARRQRGGPSSSSSSFLSPRVSASAASGSAASAYPPPAGAVTAVLLMEGGGAASDHEGGGGGGASPRRGGKGKAARSSSSSFRPAASSRFSSSSSSSPPSPLIALLRSLEWRPFCARLAALSARGLLILSTYTSAALVAARHGTHSIAGHQVVQQQQQLQLSVAWSFLHVGQAMVAAAYHAPPTAGGGKFAARKVAGAVIRWGVAWSLGAAAVTFALRHSLPTLFAHDEALLALVEKALPAAAVMLALAFNSALEGVLLGADDAPYVVRSYPWAVASCLACLWGGDWWLRRVEHRAAWSDAASAAALEGGLLLLDGAAHVARLPLLPRAQELLKQKLAVAEAGVAARGLRGVWVALAVYYAALLAAFAHRYWGRRVRI